MTADPDRQRSASGRFGFHRHRFEPVELALEVDRVLAPAGAEHRDRLVHAPAAVPEVVAQGLVLRLLPANAEAQAQAAAGQGVQGRRLLGGQHRVALRQYEDLGAKPDPGGACRHVAEGGERLHDRHLCRIAVLLPALRVMAHDHVVEDVELIEADLVHRGGKAGDGLRSLAVHDTRKLKGKLHSRCSWEGVGGAYAPARKRSRSRLMPLSQRS